MNTMKYIFECNLEIFTLWQSARVLCHILINTCFPNDGFSIFVRQRLFSIHPTTHAIRKLFLRYAFYVDVRFDERIRIRI